MMITQAKGRGLCSGEDNSEWNRDFLSISTINQLLIESVVKIKKNNCCNENETFYCIII